LLTEHPTFRFVSCLPRL